ncbi:MAG: hypothetical protein ACREUU_08570, partial [Gammaproteobacteria bacterium]
MRNTGPFRPVLAAAIAAAVLAIAAAADLPLFPVVTGSAETGLRPLGIDIAFGYPNGGYAVVANSGEDSVSIFAVDSTLEPMQKLRGIPSPYG